METVHCQVLRCDQPVAENGLRVFTALPPRIDVRMCATHAALFDEGAEVVYDMDWPGGTDTLLMGDDLDAAGEEVTRVAAKTLYRLKRGGPENGVQLAMELTDAHGATRDVAIRLSAAQAEELSTILTRRVASGRRAEESWRETGSED